MSSTSFLSEARKGHSNKSARIGKELANKIQKLYSQNVVITDENLTDEGKTMKGRIFVRDKLHYALKTTTIPLYYSAFEPDGDILRLWLKGNNTGLFLNDISKIKTPHTIKVNHNKQLCLVDSGGLNVGYLGTYNGVNSCPCWKLNGINDSAQVSNTEDLQVYGTTTGISITAWVKISAFESHNGFNRRILAKTDDNDNAYMLAIGSNNTVIFHVKFAGVEYKIQTPATLVTNTWYFIVATFKSSATPEAKLYLNAVVHTTPSISTLSYPNVSDTDLWLFCNGQTTQIDEDNEDEDEIIDLGAFSGYVRDIRLYREKVLTQQEITNFNTNKNTIYNIALGSVPMVGYCFLPSNLVDSSSFTSTSFTSTSFNL